MAYSLRVLHSDYSATDIIEVRRSSDNAESGFTASEIWDGTLAAWVGGGNDGYVKTWYDQSGNGNAATQTTTSLQPKIVSGGTLISNGITFSSDALLQISAHPTQGDGYAFLFVLFQTSAASKTQRVFDSNDNNLYGIQIFLNNTRGILNSGGLSITPGQSTSINTDYIFTWRKTTTQNGIARNNGSFSQVGDTGTINSSASGSWIGSYRGTNPTVLTNEGFSGAMKELVIWDTDIEATRASILTEINSYWSVY